MKKAKVKRNQATLVWFSPLFLSQSNENRICSLTTNRSLVISIFCLHFAYKTRKQLSASVQYWCEAKRRKKWNRCEPPNKQAPKRRRHNKKPTKNENQNKNTAEWITLCVECGFWQISLLFGTLRANYGYLLVKIILCAVIFPSFGSFSKRQRISLLRHFQMGLLSGGMPQNRSRMRYIREMHWHNSTRVQDVIERC